VPARADGQWGPFKLTTGESGPYTGSISAKSINSVEG
jgi:hypothetical protein